MGSIPRPTYRSSYRGSPIIRSLGSTNFCPGTSVYRTPLPPPKLLNHSVRNLHLRTPLRRLSLSPTRVNSVPTGRLRSERPGKLIICTRHQDHSVHNSGVTKVDRINPRHNYYGRL